MQELSMTFRTQILISIGVFIACSITIAMLFSRPSHFFLPDDTSVNQNDVSIYPQLPPLNSPNFDSVSDADLYLREEGKGIAIEGTVSRFYPYQMISWHGTITDVIDQKTILISFDLTTRQASVSGKPSGAIPFQILTWKEFRTNYPEGEALSYKTGFPFDYTREFNEND
jgi:hypothetical protein